MKSASNANLETENKPENNSAILSRLMTHFPGIIYCCHNDRKRTMEFISSGCAGITGYVPAAIINNHLVAYGDLIHPDDVDQLEEQIGAALELRRPYVLEYRIFSATHNEKWVWERGEGHFTDDGGPVMLEGVIIDVTERKHAEIALKESEEKFRIISEQSLLGIFILHQHRIIYANQTVADIIHYTIDEMLKWQPGECYKRVIHPDDMDFVMQQAFKKQEGDPDIVLRYQWRVLSKSGEVHWVESYSKTVIMNGKTADMVTVTDITHQKKKEMNLLENNKKLREIAQQYNIPVGTPGNPNGQETK